MVTDVGRRREKDRIQTDQLDVTLKFGGGVNSSASEDDINERECVLGENFEIDLNNRNFRARVPFDKIGTAPNGSEIRGFVNLVNAEGEASILVQAGVNVYKWSMSGGFNLVGTVGANAKLRGHLHQYWPLTDRVLITDINLIEPVLQWDGSALTEMAHNLSGDFKAKYCWIDDERARFANVVSNSVAIPHMIVTSEVSDNEVLSTSDKPSSALGAGDAYYLLSPDLRPINGMIGLYDVISISTERGSIFKISGTDSTDTIIGKLFPRSYATGKESIIYAGNDVVYGRGGRLESLASTDKYGDVEVDDLTIKIKDQVTGITEWDMAYNPRTQKIYVHPNNADYIWQYSKDMASSEISPWVKYTTSHESQLNPTAMMTMVDPDTNIEYVFFGDASGNIYRMEGTIGQGDGGVNDITTTWRSSVFKIPLNMRGHSFTGYVSYKASLDTSIKIKFLYGGSQPSDDQITVPIQGTQGTTFWGGDIYWGGDVYFGVSFEGRFRRENFMPAGTGEEIQIEVTHTGAVEVEINEIGIRAEASSPA